MWLVSCIYTFLDFYRCIWMVWSTALFHYLDWLPQIPAVVSCIVMIDSFIFYSNPWSVLKKKQKLSRFWSMMVILIRIHCHARYVVTHAYQEVNVLQQHVKRITTYDTFSTIRNQSIYKPFNPENSPMTSYNWKIKG